MSFLKNPFQAKYVPALIALALGVAFTAITHEATTAIIMGLLFLLQLISADGPISPIYKAMYIGVSAVFGAFAVMMVFVGAFAAAGISAGIAALPISILFTRPSA